MPQHELNRRVAAATGETVGEIARMGFQVDGPAASPFGAGSEADAVPIDWDAADAARRTDPHRCGRGRVAFH